VPGSVLDLILIVLIIIFAINGYRQGFVVGLLSFVGFFGGAAIGLQLGPVLANLFHAEVVRLVVSLGTVFGIALGGQALANWLGLRLRGGIRNRAGQTLDDIGGAFVSVVALLLVAWLVAAPLASSSLPGVARAVRTSAVLHGVNIVMPQQAQALSDELRSTVDTSGFPDVFGGLIPTNVRQVPAPNPQLAGAKVVQDSEPSVVKVEGSAPSCDRRIEGSGFVFAPGRILTNAHVVAGTRRVQVLAGGAKFAVTGSVVVYDPERDLAVISAPGLDAPALKFASGNAKTNADAIVLGYPLDGPYDAEPARVRDVRPIRGPDIYQDHTVTREIYTIRGLVRSGNSGGPLIDSDGDVLGVIFAAAADDPQTGFALTAAEARPVVSAGLNANGRVSTGACTD
jgi:S1-C subfamily serine protease